MARRPSQPMCSACLQPVMFVPTEATGKPMPLDPQQNGDGNVILLRPTLFGDQVAHVLTKDEITRGAHPDSPRYMSHFATCTELARARRHVAARRARR